MVLILLVSALMIFPMLLMMCTERRKERRDQQKVMSTRRRRRPRKKRRVRKRRKRRKTRSLAYIPIQNLLAEVILNNLLLISLFRLILILFTRLLPKPLNKHNHLFLTLPHKYQLSFHLHP